MNLVLLAHWEPIHGMIKPPKSKGSCLEYTHGQIISFGGGTDDVQSDIWSFDLEECRWSRVEFTYQGPLIEPFSYAASATTPQGQIYYFGGMRDDASVGNELIKYDPIKRTLGIVPLTDTAYVPTPNMLSSLIYVKTDTLKNDYFCALGGMSGSTLPNKEFSRFYPRESSWLAKAPSEKMKPRMNHSSVFWAQKNENGRIYFFGGFTEEGLVNDLFYLDLGKRQWVWPEATGQIPLPRAAHTSVVLDDCMIVIGGREQEFGIVKTSVCVNSVYSLDLKTHVWRLVTIDPSSQVPAPRSSHATCEANGTIYTFGGVLGSFEENQPCNNEFWALKIEKHLQVFESFTCVQKPGDLFLTLAWTLCQGVDSDQTLVEWRFRLTFDSTMENVGTPLSKDVHEVDDEEDGSLPYSSFTSTFRPHSSVLNFTQLIHHRDLIAGIPPEEVDSLLISWMQTTSALKRQTLAGLEFHLQFRIRQEKSTTWKESEWTENFASFLKFPPAPKAHVKLDRSRLVSQTRVSTDQKLKVAIATIPEEIEEEEVEIESGISSQVSIPIARPIVFSPRSIAMSPNRTKSPSKSIVSPKQAGSPIFAKAILSLKSPDPSKTIQSPKKATSPVASKGPTKPILAKNSPVLLPATLGSSKASPSKVPTPPIKTLSVIPTSSPVRVPMEINSPVKTSPQKKALSPGKDSSLMSSLSSLDEDQLVSSSLPKSSPKTGSLSKDTPSIKAMSPLQELGRMASSSLSPVKPTPMSMIGEIQEDDMMVDDDEYKEQVTLKSPKSTKRKQSLDSKPVKKAKKTNEAIELGKNLKNSPANSPILASSFHFGLSGSGRAIKAPPKFEAVPATTKRRSSTKGTKEPIVEQELPIQSQTSVDSEGENLVNEDDSYQFTDLPSLVGLKDAPYGFNLLFGTPIDVHYVDKLTPEGEWFSAKVMGYKETPVACTLQLKYDGYSKTNKQGKLSLDLLNPKDLAGIRPGTGIEPLNPFEDPEGAFDPSSSACYLTPDERQVALSGECIVNSTATLVSIEQYFKVFGKSKKCLSDPHLPFYFHLKYGETLGFKKIVKKTPYFYLARAILYIEKDESIFLRIFVDGHDQDLDLFNSADRDLIQKLLRVPTSDPRFDLTSNTVYGLDAIQQALALTGNGSLFVNKDGETIVLA